MKTCTQSIALSKLQEVYRNSNIEQKKLFDMRISDFPFKNDQIRNHFMSSDSRFDTKDALTFFELACLNCEDISSNQKIVCFKQEGLLSIAYTGLFQRSPFLTRANPHFKKIRQCYHKVGLYSQHWILLKKDPTVGKKENKPKKDKKKEKPVKEKKEKVVPIVQITVGPKKNIYKDLGEFVDIDPSSRIFLEDFIIRKNGSLLFNGVITEHDFLALNKYSVRILSIECGTVTLRVLSEIQNYLKDLGIEEGKHPFMKWKF